MSIIDDFAKLSAPMLRRVRAMVGRGVLNLVADAAGMQGVQVGLLAGEVRDGVERFQQYGFSSHPHPGAEVLFLSVGGSRDHGVVVAIDDRRHRVCPIEVGEVVLYTDEDGNAGLHRIHLKRGREIHLVAGESSIVMRPEGITITTPSLDIIKA